MNLEIWGSFTPITPQSYDIQIARALAYTKITKLRGRLGEIIKENVNLEGKVLSESLTRVQVIDFYFGKLE